MDLKRVEARLSFLSLERRLAQPPRRTHPNQSSGLQSSCDEGAITHVLRKVAFFLPILSLQVNTRFVIEVPGVQLDCHAALNYDQFYLFKNP